MHKNISMNDTITLYARSDNSKKIIILNGKRPSFRCRQRSILSDKSKRKPLKFVSFKETQKMITKNGSKVVGPFDFYTISKL